MFFQRPNTMKSLDMLYSNMVSVLTVIGSTCAGLY
jgi:hypothetical protein